MAKRILLTGASGFIGRHCLPLLLAKGYEVHAVTSKPSPPSTVGAAQNLYWHHADLLDPGELDKLLAEVLPVQLLHFAWYAVPHKYWTSAENLRWVRASLHLVQSFAAHGGERLVAAGSCAEYDWNYGYCSESVTPLLPGTLYGNCKHSLQLMLNAFSRETGLSSAWGRIFFVYGPHEHPHRLVSSVIRALLQGQAARCTSGDQVRDFLHVAKAASAFVALLESQVQGPVNIASGRPVLLKELVGQIAEKIGRCDLLKLGEISPPANDPPVLLAATARLRHEVKWLDSGSLEDDLTSTIQWWQNHLAQGGFDQGHSS